MKEKIIFILVTIFISCANANDRFFEIQEPCANNSPMEFKAWEICLEKIKTNIPMYNNEKRHLYYEAYQKTDDEIIYNCTESCEHDCFQKDCELVCKGRGDFGQIIEQPSTGMVFKRYAHSYQYLPSDVKLFHKDPNNKNSWHFGTVPETDHEHITIDRDRQTADYGIEGHVQKCYFSN